MTNTLRYTQKQRLLQTLVKLQTHLVGMVIIKPWLNFEELCFLAFLWCNVGLNSKKYVQPKRLKSIDLYSGLKLFKINQSPPSTGPAQVITT